LPSFSDPEWVEDRIETDAPVSRTRDSDMPGFRSPVFRKLRRRLRRFVSTSQLARGVAIMGELRKRNLVVVAVGGGVLIGVLITWTLLATEPPSADSRELGQASPRAIVASPVTSAAALAPVPSVVPAGAAPTASALSSSSAIEPSTDRRDSGTPPAATSPKRRPAPTAAPVPPPPPRRRVVRGPDYGI
jgi:hypothetical protein